jgi:Cu-processing system permease protein
MSALLIARLTLKEAAKKRLLLLTVIGGLLFLALFGIGTAVLLSQITANASNGLGGLEKSVTVILLQVLGFYVLNFLAGISAIFISVNAICGETESGTVHALLAHPVRRRDIVLGKWLAYALILTLYVAVMSAGLIEVTNLVNGYSTPIPFAAIGLMILVTLVVLSLSLLGSTFLSTLVNGIAIFLLYGLAWLGGMIEVIGLALQNTTMNYIGIVVSLIMPTDALWRGASYYLQPPWVSVLQNTQRFRGYGGELFLSTAPPTMTMIIYAGAYSVIALGLAVLIFHYRDL